MLAERMHLDLLIYYARFSAPRGVLPLRGDWRSVSRRKELTSNHASWAPENVHLESLLQRPLEPATRRLAVKRA